MKAKERFLTSVKNSSRHALPWFAALLILSFLYLRSVSAQTQPDLPSYWQYPASGRVIQVVTADVNYDGVEEILIADENGRIDLIDADGSHLWDYTAPDFVQAINAFNLDGPDNPQLEILVGIPDSLIILSAAGEEIERLQLNPYAISPALLAQGGLEAQQEWLDAYNFQPLQITPWQNNVDDRPGILVLLRTGHIQLFNADGEQIWNYNQRTVPISNNPPQMIVNDFDQDGQDEIALTLFGPRRFSQLILIDDGAEQWDIPHSGRITAITPIQFSPDSPAQIAVGTSLGHVYLYNHDRERIWFRTLNKTVTSLAPVPIRDGQILAAGTNSGTITAFDQAGRRLWSNNLAANADQRILALSASSQAPVDARFGATPTLAAIMETDPSGAAVSDIILLNSDGQALSKLATADTSNLSRFIDSNDDGLDELLITRFATLELLGLGAGNSENVKEWEYSLNAAPSAALAADFDGDGEEELVIGTQDGRIHSLSNDRVIRWLHDPGNHITNLALMPGNNNQPDYIVIVRNQKPEEATIPPSSWIELRENRGERLWEQTLDAPVTALAVENINSNDAPEVLAGLDDGRIYIFDANGNPVWEYLPPEESTDPIQHLSISPANNAHPLEIIAATGQAIFALDINQEDTQSRAVNSFNANIVAVFPLRQPGNDELSINFLVFTDDGAVHGLNWRGIEMAQWPWPQYLTSPPRALIQDESEMQDSLLASFSSFLLATEDGQVMQLDVEENQPSYPWSLANFGAVTSLHWRDTNQDGRPNLILIGNQAGQVWLFDQTQSRIPEPALDPLNLSSAVFAIMSLNREVSQSPDLLAITENGLVQLFREQENRPPLLFNPKIESGQGQFGISISVTDVENDNVTVQLELFDPELNSWIPLESQIATTGNNTLFWPVVSPPASPEGLRYRFFYDDGFYSGYITPPSGPPPLITRQLTNVLPNLLLGAGVVGLLIAFLLLRQSRTPSARARRFYRRLKQQPSQILLFLEKKYTQTAGSPDFLLSLANHARQANDRQIANLADGLFLLPERPQAGLSIMNRTLDAMRGLQPPWEGLKRWQMTYKTSQELLDAPTITELSLLHPQLIQLLVYLDTLKGWSPALEALRPILTNLRDSERVDTADDRLVYLNEASPRIQQALEQLPDYKISIERTVVLAILRRWAGLVGAAIEEQRGQANLVVSLKTKRLAPNRHADVALEIHNNGRSAAENIIAVLDLDPAFKVYSPPQMIPFLPPGRTSQIRFSVEPQVLDRFRISVSLTYDDRNQNGKTIAFGDMVHLLSPVRDYKPITNPYMPGTPLRSNSPLFYGREDLFEFVIENAGTRSQLNAMILVGQRRTGKTSALLRLQDYLPDHLLPVYIDCQSLGVTPGMPALLQEFAWYIADALALRDLDINVPALAAWQEDPTYLFQREFLPQVKALLPPENSILLVFDEFEAFESLVEDGIIPSTFFTYLRHLMQHQDQLGFIFVGTRRLEEMTSDYWSVLFNIALYRKIDFLDTYAATRLITEPVAPNLVYDDLALDKVLRVTAGHPYFLQLVCYTLVKRANIQRTGYVTISDVNAAVDEMLSLGEVHFAYLWQRSSPTERVLLTAVAHLMDQNKPFHPEELLQYLEPYDITLNPAEVTSALNRLVERDIMREVTEQAHTLYEIKLGLVSLWVARNKSLSKLYAERETAVNGDNKSAGKRVQD